MSGAGTESGRTALLDACTLIPIRLTTTLLWLAEARLYEVLWSAAILDEVERNLPKIGISSEQAARRVATMRDAFGAAALVDDFENLIPDMTCDAKDRHVLAAAVRGGADTLVTFNGKDFPPESVDEHGIEVVHPDLFLLQLLAERPTDVVAAIERGTAALKKPPQTMREFLASMTRTVPMFANLAADAAASPPRPRSPFPALVSADEGEAVAALGEPGDLTNPAQVAFAWWAGILNDLDTARVLTFDPSAWGDYQWAVDMLSDKSLATKVIPAVDAPQHVAFMRFVPEVAATAQVFASYPTSATFLTLVRIEDGTWRVWGLGSGMPAASDILGEEFASAQRFITGGGTPLVFEWLTRIAEPDPPVELIWGSLDEPLRLAMAQSWLLGTGEAAADDPQRDDQAALLSARESTHPLFAQFYRWLVAHYQDVYRDISGKPCLVGVTESVGVDLELDRLQLRGACRNLRTWRTVRRTFVHHPASGWRRLGHRSQRPPHARSRLATDRTGPARSARRRQLVSTSRDAMRAPPAPRRCAAVTPYLQTGLRPPWVASISQGEICDGGHPGDKWVGRLHATLSRAQAAAAAPTRAKLRSIRDERDNSINTPPPFGAGAWPCSIERSSRLLPKLTRGRCSPS